MRAKRKWIELSVKTERDKAPLRIVSDGAIATGVIGDGRLIPVLVLDTTKRRDVDELIRVHQHFGPGDVVCMWGSITGSDDRVCLVLNFTRPTVTTIVLEFDVLKQGGVVDQIVTSHAVYLQSSRDGDHVSTALHRPKILVEVPDTGFFPIWDRILKRRVAMNMRRQGLSRRGAKQAAEQAINAWRAFLGVRIPSRK